MKAPRVARTLNILAILLAGFLVAAPHAASDQIDNAASGVAPATFAEQFGEREPNSGNAGWRSLPHGLRAAEVVALRWDSVDFGRGELHVSRVKNGTMQPL